MPSIALTSVNRGPDRNFIIRRQPGGSVTVIAELTEQEKQSCMGKGGGVPPGLTREEWDSGEYAISGRNPGYQNGRLGTLAHGEVHEEEEAFCIGLLTNLGTTITAEIQKADVIIDRAQGLSLAPRTAFSEKLAIVSIVDGVLETRGPVELSALEASMITRIT